MTTQYPIDTTPEQPIDAKPEKKRRWVTPTVAVVALLMGVGIGNSTDPEPEVIEAEPEVITETVVETETVTETVEVEVEVEVAPQACLDAVNSARAGFSIAGEMMGVLGPAVEAASMWDIAGLDAAMDDLEALNADLEKITFVEDAAACEAAAR